MQIPHVGISTIESIASILGAAATTIAVIIAAHAIRAARSQEERSRMSTVWAEVLGSLQKVELYLEEIHAHRLHPDILKYEELAKPSWNDFRQAATNYSLMRKNISETETWLVDVATSQVGVSLPATSRMNSVLAGHSSMASQATSRVPTPPSSYSRP